jgi:p21-activated kinase 1
MDASPSPDPSKVGFSPSAHHHLLVSATDTFGGVRKDEEDADMYEEEDIEENDEHDGHAPAGASIARPKIVISGAPGSNGIPTPLHSGTVTSPLSPFQRYRGWLSEVVAPLEEFIDETVDPRDYYLDLQEIAEGESGSVYAARLTDINIHKLKLPPLIKARDGDDLGNGRITLVAIKSVAIMPSGSPKLVDLKRELTLMKGLWHDNVLSMDALYVDLVEDALWIRMELMERSLADLIGLIGSGLMLQERMMARFANDVCPSTRNSKVSLLICSRSQVLQALQYLEQHCIAHRDVRSDNLLVNSHGILKLSPYFMISLD